MSPDVGAIIGISLAGSVLCIALLFLCMMHLPWSCCKNWLTPTTGNGNHRVGRPSTSSRTAFASSDLQRLSRNIDQLSAMDLHHQNQAHFYSPTGIVNPLWQIHCTCHPSGMLNASQQSLNFAHCHSTNHCQFHHNFPHQVNPGNLQDADHSANLTDPSGFQYFAPQLHSPTESPPPYPGLSQPANSEPYRASAPINSTNANVSNPSSNPPAAL